MNIIPKFVDEGASLPAKAVGSTLADIWNLSIGNHVSLWAKKQEAKQEANFQEYIKEIENQTRSIPEANLVDPRLHIVGPALEASKYYIDSQELRNMFAKLIASSIDSRKINFTHPSFVEIIKQINTDEAKIIKYINPIDTYPVIRVRGYDEPKHGRESFAQPLVYFSTIPYLAQCNNPDLGESYLENLSRLGIFEINYDFFTLRESYEPLEQHSVVLEKKKLLESNNKKVRIDRGALILTSHGKKFYEACIL